MHLASDQGEAGPQLQQEALDMAQQASLDRTFVGVVAQVEEVEEVGVLGDLLSKIGLRGRQGRREVAHRPALPRVQRGLDLQGKDIARPAVLDGLGRVPEAVGRVCTLSSSMQ